MADWGPWVGDVEGQLGAYNVTPSATSHVKGTLSYGITDTSRSEGLLIMFSWHQNHSTIRTLLYDVGIGSGSDILIANLMHCPPAGGSSLARSMQQAVYFPVAVPADQLRMRSQSSMASHGICYMMTQKKKSGLPVVGSVVDTYGADTANTKGVTVTAPNNETNYGSWAQLTASSERIKALILAVGHGQENLSALSNQWHHIELGIGGAGSEVAFVRFEEAGGSSSSTLTPAPGYLGPLYVDIPAGSRISARVRKQIASSAQRTLSLIAYGIR
jgi:hypothetical protein